MDNEKRNIVAEIKFRILSKSKTGCAVRIFGQVMEYTWEEFNKVFVVKDKIYAYFNPEYEQMITEYHTDIKHFSYTCDMAQAISMLGGQPPLYILATLGKYHEIICDIFPLFSMHGQVSFARLYTKLSDKKAGDDFRKKEREKKVIVDVPKFAETKDGRKVKRDVVERVSGTLMADVPGAAELMKQFNIKDAN